MPSPTTSQMQRPAFIHSSTSFAVPSPPPEPFTDDPYPQYPATPNEKRSVSPATSGGQYTHTQYLPPVSEGQRNVVRGVYGYRRAPSRLDEVVGLARSRGRGWWGRWRDREGGGLGRWLVLGWVATTVGFLGATAFWRGELFAALDRLSKDLAALEWRGQLIFGALIVLTTIPPLPLYSTLIVLSGYTFGVWQGFVVSYLASLSGAVLVFLISRALLKDVIAKSLSSSPTFASLLQIIPQCPHLLLLIRIAPYPYNLLNVLLASSPLSLKSYTACTALSLCKLILHTWIGAGIHDLSRTYSHTRVAPPSSHIDPNQQGIEHPQSWEDTEWDNTQRDDVKFYSTILGIGMCIGLFFYLTHLAKKALERAREEQEGREGMTLDGGLEEGHLRLVSVEVEQD